MGALNPVTDFIREREIWTQRHTQREGERMKTEAEIGVA